MRNRQLLAIGIGEFADKVFRIQPFRPSFGNLSANRARRPAQLIG